MSDDRTPPRVVPLHNPNVAETVSVLARAMAFTKPSPGSRERAGAHPVSNAELATVAALYANVEGAETRQAILDVLVAIGRMGNAG